MKSRECMNSKASVSVTNRQIEMGEMVCPHCKRAFKVRAKSWTSEDNVRTYPRHVAKVAK